MATPAEVIEQSMASGFDEGLQRRHQNQDFHRQTEWQDKHTDLRDAIKNTQQKLWNLDKSSPDYAAQHAQGVKDLTSSIQAYQDFLHPTKNPGMWEKVRSGLGMDGKPHPLAAPERISSETTPGVAASTVDLGTGGASFPASAPVTVTGPNGQSSVSTPQGVSVPSASSPVTLAATPSAHTSAAGPTPTPDESSSKPLYPSQVKERAKRLQQSQKEASLLSSGAPPTPEEAAARESGIANTTEMSKRDASLKWARDNGISGPELDELKQHLSGLPVAKVPKAIGVPYKDANDGKWYQRTQNPIDGTFSQVEVPGYSQTARPSTSAFNEMADAYAKSYGIAKEDLTPEDYDYITRKAALDKAIPSSNTTTTLKEDAEGQYRPVTETNYRTPGGNISLVAPRGKAPSQESPSAAGGKASRTPSTPSEVKKEADKRAPKAASSPNASTPPKGTGHTSVGQPLFPGKNKEYDDDKVALASAKTRVETMDKSAADAYSGDQQAMLSLIANHIGMTLGAQKGARINQAVWNEAVNSAPYLEKIYSKFGHFEPNGDWVLDTPFNGFKGGVTLTGDQIKSMVKLAHEQVDTLQHARDRKHDELYGGTSVGGGSAQSSSEPNKKYKHSATGPNKHKIGTDDDPESPDAKWFDIQTGKPI